MQIIRLTGLGKTQATGSTSFIEYFFSDKRLGGAYIEIDGRYPGSGFAVNHVSSELAYVIKGTGSLVTESATADFQKGDSLFIPPEEKFHWQGTCTLYVVTSPAFDPAQHSFVK